MRFFTRKTYSFDHFNNDLSNFLRLYRKAKGFTLESVSYGVCSTSWLSKFEKGEVLPNYDMIYGVIKNLETAQFIELDLLQNTYDLFYDYYFSYEFDNKKKCNDIMSRIQINEEIYLNTFILFDYLLLRLLHTLNNGDFVEYEAQVQWIKSYYEQGFSPSQKQYFLYLQGLGKMANENLEECEFYFNEALKFNGFKSGMFLYHLSRMYLYLNKPSLSIKYGEMALNEFGTKNNYYRLLFTNVILGNAYFLFKWNDKALEYFDKVAKLAYVYNDRIYPIFFASYSKVLLYISIKSFSEAIDVIQQALTFDVQEENKEDLYFYAAYCYAEFGDEEQFNHYYSKTKKSTLPDFYKHIIDAKKIYITNRDQLPTTYYKKLLKAENCITEDLFSPIVCHFYEQVIDYLELQGKYKDAYLYSKKLKQLERI